MGEIEEGRFELRVWGELGAQRRRLESDGAETGRSASSDLYVIGPDLATNAKIRDGALEVKHLVETRGILQRWRPAWSIDLPLDRSAIARLWRDVGLGVLAVAAASPSTFDEGDLRAEARRWPGALLVLVHKQRRHFDYRQVTGEVTTVTVEGTDPVDSVVVEHHDPRRVRRASEALEMSGPNRPVHEHALKIVDRQG